MDAQYPLCRLLRQRNCRCRSKLSVREFSAEGYEIYRPLLNWTVEDVFSMHKKHDIEPNPLYLQGMGRVGCMPCIHSRKSEIYEIAKRFPEEIERIAEWEAIVSKASKRGSATFFTSDRRGHGIDEVVKWAHTGYGGKNYDLFKTSDDVESCSSQYGLCE